MLYLSLCTQVDAPLARSLTSLLDIAERYRVSTDTAEQTAIAADVDSMWLVWCLPGYAWYELCQGGADRSVTAQDLPAYVAAVVEHLLITSVQHQFLQLQRGFADVVPLGSPALHVFQPEELQHILGADSDSGAHNVSAHCCS